MNIFILNAGRCGSTTFVQACQHISNYTAAHESRSTLTGKLRLSYPDNHIEADNRLCWILGRLEREYGNDAYYVHLTRDRRQSVESFVKRKEYGIMQAYREGILMGGQQQSAAEIASDYLDTVACNISLFLKDKRHKMAFSLENAASDFVDFWHWIGAQGELDKALAEWRTRYNASV
ncbi:MAG: hypothetical protein AB2672_17665 [Candidatus Thiodiazotropha endolucinida]|nr:hypothetical protein [Candidatus Thiodiazotropha sp. (ex Lucina pensylvanica)]MBT3042816.1 hypothetical protein [Candidatus Thiodiazotropha sp. (ex Codakia orbicularis)]MCG7877267.1 hypothetical protein [Candidatus Thiodiazotropha taylori]MCG8094722.1 hypothetical protein [Candidatus Thiodiazotropha endolucinida]MBT3050523.1 hypothetical protein [Candidatus Thiodiazotropha sp. (ex Codakia orbicularis)]